jgi:hypothetical protein
MPANKNGLNLFPFAIVSIAVSTVVRELYAEPPTYRTSLLPTFGRPSKSTRKLRVFAAFLASNKLEVPAAVLRANPTVPEAGAIESPLFLK